MKLGPQCVKVSLLRFALASSVKEARGKRTTNGTIRGERIEGAKDAPLAIRSNDRQYRRRLPYTVIVS
jgi:hypothetical protein